MKNIYYLAIPVIIGLTIGFFIVGSENEVDQKLSDEMALVRNIVSLGLRVRTNHKLKVRQPLSLAEVILTDASKRAALTNYCELIADELNVQKVVLITPDEGHMRYAVRPNFRRLGPRLGKKMPLAKKIFQSLDASQLQKKLHAVGKVELKIGGETVTLDAEDVEVSVEASEHYAAAGDHQAVVVLNTDLSEELLKEGLYRDLLRHVQDLRRELDIEYTGRIRLLVSGSEKITHILEMRREHFMEETLCSTLDIETDRTHGGEHRELEIAGETITVTLTQI